ncbi:MAG: RNA-binding domain-containing protein, partial [bacterium]
VEFKAGMPWSDESKYGIIKAVMAFANGGGGRIIIGYNEGAEIGKRREGVSERDRKTWDITNVSRDVCRYSDPPIDVDLAPIPDQSRGVVYIVLSVPPHGTVPHICSKDAHRPEGAKAVLEEGAVYYRTAAGESKKISSSREWKDLIYRCVLNTKDDLAAKFLEILKGEQGSQSVAIAEGPDLNELMDHLGQQSKVDHPGEAVEMIYMDVICRPSPSIPWAEPKLSVVTAALSEADVDYRGWPFVFFRPDLKFPPRYDDGMVWAATNEPFYDRLIYHFWTFDYRSGVFFSQNLIPEASLRVPKTVDPFPQVSIVAEAAVAQGRLYANLGFSLDTQMQFGLRYINTQGAAVRDLDPKRHRIWMSSPPYQGARVSHRVYAPLSEFAYKPASLAADLVVSIVEKMGMPEAARLRGALVTEAEKHLSKRMS